MIFICIYTQLLCILPRAYWAGPLTPGISLVWWPCFRVPFKRLTTYVGALGLSLGKTLIQNRKDNFVAGTISFGIRISCKNLRKLLIFLLNQSFN